MRKTEILVPDADAFVLVVPLSGALPPIGAQVSVVSVDAAPDGVTGWRLLDAMRSRFEEIRRHSEAVVELPVDPGVDGSLEVLSLRPEQARLCGQLAEAQVEAFVSACRQFDVVPVIPWRWRALAPGRRRCVMIIEDPLDRPGEPVPAHWALRLEGTGDLPVGVVVERIMAPDETDGATGLYRSLRAHREWLDSLEVREPCG